MNIVCHELSGRREPKFEPKPEFSEAQRKALELVNEELARQWKEEDCAVVLDCGAENTVAGLATPTFGIAIAEVDISEFREPRKVWVLREYEEILTAGAYLLSGIWFRPKGAWELFKHYGHLKWKHWLDARGLSGMFWRNVVVAHRRTGWALIEMGRKSVRVSTENAENSLGVREFFWRRFGVEITNPEDVKEVLEKL